MKDFKKDLACNITLIAILVCCITHLTFLTLGLFNVISLDVCDDFNYIVAYTLCFISLALFICAFSITKLKNWTFPSFLRIMTYVLFFLFLNTYYILNWWNNIFAALFFDVYIAFIVCIISVSLFYNIHKDDKNKLKTSKTYISNFIFTYSVSICSILLLVSGILKSFIFKTYAFSTLSAFVLQFSTMVLTCVVMLIVFNVSLSKTKKFINLCLIKKTSK